MFSNKFTRESLQEYKFDNIGREIPRGNFRIAGGYIEKFGFLIIDRKDR